MNNSNIKQIADLEAEIRKHLLLYYDLHAPIITDSVFDKMYEQLQKLDPNSPVLNERSQFDGDFKHIVPMGSLPKVKTAAELCKKFKGKTVSVTLKVDGAGLTHKYKNFHLLVSATRGKTETLKGKNVTVITTAIANVPLTVSISSDFEVRGEAVILKKDWELVKAEQPELSNARNAASGGINSRSLDDVANRRLTFIAYKVVQEFPASTHDDTLEMLEEQGFIVPQCEIVTITSEEQVQDLVDRWAVIRASAPYETDGIVIRLNDEKAFSDAGMTGTYWNGGSAFKYENEQAETVLRDIVIETGRLGYVTPVGIFDPIKLGNAMIERCTLNNWDWMSEHGNPSIGAKIVVAKMNDIIPNLIEVLENGNGDTKEPTVCPSCGTKLVKVETGGDGEGKKLKCQNGRFCPAQFSGSVMNILQKLEIKGMGDTTVDKIINAKLIERPWEIFGLEVNALTRIGFGAQESANIVASLKNVSTEPTNILAAVGIEMWGRRLFDKLQKMAPAFTDERLLAGDFPVAEVSRAFQIGSVRAAVLAEEFKPDGYGREFLNGLLKWVKPILKETNSAKDDGNLNGKTFLITGTLSKSRKFIEADIISAGGCLASGVSKNLSYLVVGEDAGSKLDKAQKLGVAILSESDLYAMMSTTPT
jgi:DNA ligase (NAD+)